MSYQNNSFLHFVSEHNFYTSSILSVKRFYSKKYMGYYAHVLIWTLYAVLDGEWHAKVVQLFNYGSLIVDADDCYNIANANDNGCNVIAKAKYILHLVKLGDVYFDANTGIGDTVNDEDDCNGAAQR